MALNLAGFQQAGWERDCQLAAVVVVFYEHILQFGNEVELFWKKQWSFPKCLFLWCRYYTMGFTLGNAIVFLQQHKDPNVSFNFFRWQDTGAILQTLTTHFILELRLYAMYERSKKMLAFFVCLTACEVAVMAVLFGVPVEGLVGTNNPFPGLFICADADPADGRHWMAYFSTANLGTETVLLTCALYKAWSHHRRGNGGGLMTQLTRQSALYFFMIVWVHLVNQVIWIVNRITLNELATGFSFAIPAILANRLLISVRGDNNVTEEGTHATSLRFTKPAVSAGAGTSIDHGRSAAEVTSAV